MIYPEAIQFLYDLRWFGAKFGLSNTLKLAELAGNPQHRLRFIHVAGTNGKGSTCAMLESIYRESGLRVGLFTSPHLVAFGERLQVNRRPIPEAEVIRLVAEMQTLLAQGWGALATEAQNLGFAHGPGDRHSETHPTFFEVVTVMALRHFAEQRCDLVIWETGLGGRLDATNIVTPLASVITNIQFDHQKWLGETLASIAGEKAGIIKPGVPVLTATDEPEALRVIEAKAREQEAPLTVLSRAAASAPPLDTVQLPLLGQHQKLNAALALATVHQLQPLLPVPAEVVRAGLGRVNWPGRLQLITQPSGQKILLDGAHNVAGAQVLGAALREHFASARPALVLGILEDKDWPGMCAALAPLADHVYLVPVHSDRSAVPDQLLPACRQANSSARIQVCASLSAALTQAEPEPFVVIAGSLYLVGEALELLHCTDSGALGERSLNEWSPKPVMRS